MQRPSALPLVLAWAVLAGVPAWAGALAPDSPASFALISPAVADQLKAQAATPAAQSLLKLASEGLTKTPSPMARVHTEGTLPHQGIYDQSAQAEKDWTLMLTLGMAYRLTGDARYLQAGERFISAWLGVYTLNFNPIDETNLDQMILGYDLTATGLSQPTREKMTAFLRAMAEGYLDRIAHAKSEDTANNWQSHRIKLIALSAYAVGDADLIARARQAFQRQISVNIKPDGSVFDFAERDALHYVVYDLEPLTMAALAAKAHGEDWFHAATPGGPSVELAIDWLTPFALGQKTHEDFVHTSVAFDAIRAKAGLKGYSGLWEPVVSFHLYQLAALADPKYASTFQQIALKSQRVPQGWVALLQQTHF